ncbi:hypothetical protein GN958_ATG15723 [Phytophthora infestans]|uniref:Uncharacterized protein n=1 Tax=Phytophthora infestans TaxID=4787 RepID=A0A8S9U486_PHYIN|nr:hypothetical protein GN958_ATG15723 [Phytophthora infestans]
MRKPHWAKQKGERSANNAVCDKSEQEEEQHVSSAAVAEVWGLAVVAEGSASETLSEDWNGDRDSDTTSELMEAEKAESSVETASTASEEDEGAGLLSVRFLT